MSSGLVWDEVNLLYSNPSNSYRIMTASSDPYRYVVSQKLVAKPGTAWNYNGGGTALPGAILKKVGKRPLDEFAKEALFEPLGITDWEWEHAANGNANCSGWVEAAATRSCENRPACADARCLAGPAGRLGRMDRSVDSSPYRRQRHALRRL